MTRRLSALVPLAALFAVALSLAVVSILAG